MAIKGWGLGSNYKSSYNWEDSYYGGYAKVIRDLPEIKVDFDMEVDISDAEEKSDLSYMNLKKLGKLFLLKVKQYGLTEEFLLGIKDKEISRYSNYKRVVHIVDPEGTRMALNSIIAKDPELSNLFKEYKKDIPKINYYYDKYEDKTDFEKRTEEEKRELFRNIINNINKAPTYNGSSNSSFSIATFEKIPQFLLPKSTIKPTIYTQDQLMCASKLLKQLDITFDPAVSIIKNIKAGKLDINKLAEVIPGNNNIYYKTEINQTTKPFSVCILCDESGSMGKGHGSKLESQHNIVKILHKTFSEILPPDKLYIYGHTGSIVPEIYIYQDKYNNDFEHAIDDMLRRQISNNYDGPVIESIYKKIRSETEDNIIFIAISDGNPAGYGYGGQKAIEELQRIIEKCKRDGFVTVGIGVEHGAIKDIYNYHAIVRNNNDDIIKKTSQLINTVVKTEFK